MQILQLRLGKLSYAPDVAQLLFDYVFMQVYNHGEHTAQMDASCSQIY